MAYVAKVKLNLTFGIRRHLSSYMSPKTDRVWYPSIFRMSQDWICSRSIHSTRPNKNTFSHDCTAICYLTRTKINSKRKHTQYVPPSKCTLYIRGQQGYQTKISIAPYSIQKRSSRILLRNWREVEAKIYQMAERSEAELSKFCSEIDGRLQPK